MVFIKKLLSASLFFLAIAVATEVNALTTIRSISFEGNDVTDELFLRRTIYLTEGSIYDETCLEESVQALMDTGLFKSVDYYESSDFPEDEYADDSQVDLVIRVREKHYMLILPRVRVRDNETHIGIQLRWDNLFGKNHQLRYLAEDRGSTANIDETRTEFEYGYPNVNGSSYSLEFFSVEQNEVDQSVPGFEINRMDKLYGFNVHRWLNPYGRNYGWFAGIGWSVNDRHNEVLYIDGVDDDVSALVLRLAYGFSKTHDYVFNRAGQEYGYAVNIANRIWSSDAEFARHELYYRSYYRFPSRPLDNLNVQTILGHATHDIMGNEAFDLGGEDLRGYDPGRFTGNALLQINVEYLRPFEDHPQWRYAGFVDMGNTYDDVEDVIHGGLKTGVGVGLRWKLVSFVKVSLRVDVGYAISDKDFRVTAGTNYAY